VTSDEVLLERALGGDLGAFDQIYARYEQPLFSFVLGMLGDRAEAEEVLQDAFLTLIREGGDAERLKPWIYQVARNLSLNRLRSRRRAAEALTHLAEGPPRLAPDPERGALERETAVSLRQAVDRLPQGMAEVYALRASGLSYQEVADLLQIPLGTVKSRMNQLIQRLREELKR
jgi:RNA polymerase sigma-70 factor (ECF subfamily)